MTGFHRRDDDKHRVQDPERDQDRNAYEHDAKDRGDRVVDQHRDLKIKRLFPVGIDLG